MINGVQLTGRAYDIETHEYSDGAVITHFRVAFPRATRTDQIPCRMIQRRGTGFAQQRRPREGEPVLVAGTLTTLGTEGLRVCVDVRTISYRENWGD